MQRFILLCSILFLSRATMLGLCTESNVEPEGVQGSGAIYRIYMPEESCWNGDLVVYAHGYIAFNEPFGIPEHHLVVDDVSIPAIVNALGYAFAVTSYSQNGLAILEGVDDVVDLVSIFNSTHTPANRVFLAGVSEGGIVTTLAIERHPDVFDGGVAACGPIGDFQSQINYLGNFRVVFDYFFPGALLGNATEIPPFLYNNWDSYYVPLIHNLVPWNPGKIDQLLAVTHAPVDPNDPATRAATVEDILWYSAFATNDAALKLGGNPFGNYGRWYTGSNNDLALNRFVARHQASPTALAAVQEYRTTGNLQRPLTTLHTTGDPVVPYTHEVLYTWKTVAAGTSNMRVNLPIDRYGHCEFQVEEVVAAFVITVAKAGAAAAPDAELALPTEAARQRFRQVLRSAAAGQTGTGAGSTLK